MPDHKYGFKDINKDKHAWAVERSMPISTRSAVEVCRMVRKKPFDKAVKILELVSAKKLAVPFKRYNRGGVGHHQGLGPSRFPIKTSSHILKLLKSVSSNAEQKGLNKNMLAIAHIAAHGAARTRHFGRKRARIMKRTTIEVVLEERAIKK